MPEANNLEKLNPIESGQAERTDSNQTVEGGAIEAVPDRGGVNEIEPVVSESIVNSGAQISPDLARYKEVEGVLEEDLGEIFFTMPPEKQQQFKVEGEKTARNIMVILEGSRIKVKNIIKLIVRWLKLLPGVNQFFLEQTAKIKADKVLDTVEGQDKKIIR